MRIPARKCDVSLRYTLAEASMASMASRVIDTYLGRPPTLQFVGSVGMASCPYRAVFRVPACLGSKLWHTVGTHTSRVLGFFPFGTPKQTETSSRT